MSAAGSYSLYCKHDLMIIIYLSSSCSEGFDRKLKVTWRIKSTEKEFGIRIKTKFSAADSSSSSGFLLVLVAAVPSPSTRGFPTQKLISFHQRDTFTQSVWLSKEQILLFNLQRQSFWLAPLLWGTECFKSSDDSHPNGRRPHPAPRCANSRHGMLWS